MSPPGYLFYRKTLLHGAAVLGDKVNRYYHCRGTYSTATRERVCNARYIKADWLETAVWEEVKKVLSKPEVLMGEVSQQIKSDMDHLTTGSLDKEIKTLTRKMKGYAGQERRLAKVLRMNVISSDVVLDELNQLKKEREIDQDRLQNLKKAKANISRMDDFEDKLRDLCNKIIPELDVCTNDEKKEAYTYLDLKVKATQEGAEIKGFIDPRVRIAGQSWE